MDRHNSKETPLKHDNPKSLEPSDGAVMMMPENLITFVDEVK
jgi:hypothetical protein